MCIKCVLVLLALSFRTLFFLRVASVFPYCFDGYFPRNLCLSFFLIFRHPLFITWLLQKSPRKETSIKERSGQKTEGSVFSMEKKDTHRLGIALTNVQLMKFWIY